MGGGLRILAHPRHRHRSPVHLTARPLGGGHRGKHDLLTACFLALVLVGCSGSTPEGPRLLPAFHDVAADVGIDFVHERGARGDYHYPETFGAGAAWLDFDADGWLDLYLVNGGDLEAGPSLAGANRLWRNTGAQGHLGLVDVTTSTGAGEPGYGMGVCAADIEADGDLDIFVTNVGANALLVQSGGRFADAAPAAGGADPRWGTGAAFFDADLDGDLDLAVINYVPFDLDDNADCRRGSVRTYCDPESYEPAADILYRNDSDDGGPRLTDVTSKAGFTGLGRGLGLALTDVDLDGDTDVFIANDGTTNLLYRNDTSQGGRIHFAEVGLQAGVQFNLDGRAEAGMGTDFGDVDGDGWPDLVVANFSRETNTLYRHTGTGLVYVDDTIRHGLAQASFMPLGFGAAWFDADADGDLDLAVANGHVLDRAADIDDAGSYEQPDQLFLYDGDGFVDHSPRLGQAWSQPRVSRALVPGDFDNDGDEDLLITASGGAPRLLRNDLEGGSWLTLRLHSHAAGNRHALGARIVIDTGQSVLHRQMHGGGSYLAGRPPRVHVGLGTSISARVTVYWPGGGVEGWTLSAGDHDLVQGQAP